MLSEAMENETRTTQSSKVPLGFSISGFDLDLGTSQCNQPFASGSCQPAHFPFHRHDSFGKNLKVAQGLQAKLRMKPTWRKGKLSSKVTFNEIYVSSQEGIIFASHFLKTSFLSGP